MDAVSYLQDYSQRADIYIADYFQEKMHEVEDSGKTSNGLGNIPQRMLEMYWEHMKGGKKIRGSLVQLGYELGGGSHQQILPAAVAMEVIHTFLLMHDDVMDQDGIRRGKTTIHKQWESFGDSSFLSGSNTGHYGESMAYTLGDIGCFMGIELFCNTDLTPQQKITAIQHLTKFLTTTGYGQAFDITFENVDHLTEDDILKVHTYKTAWYTIIGPLQLGGILGGLSDTQLEALKQFGLGVGTAFQLRDDELGLFGDEKTIGKPVGSDIRENKSTLLRVKAFELASEADRAVLKKLYGKPDLTSDEIAKVQKITRQTGALAYSQQLTNKLVDEGKQAIPQITDQPEYQLLLNQLADLMVKREK